MSVSVSTSSHNASDTKRYVLIERLKNQYVADVFLAQDTQRGYQVILKALPREFANNSDPVAQYHLDQFREEAQATTELIHPNIVNAFSSGNEQDPFVVMEYVDGVSLADLLQQRGPLDAGEIAMLGAQIAAALQFAHASGRVHGGLSPENILIDADNMVKVGDFGVTLIRSYYGNPRDPSADLMAAAYHSPEHANGTMIDAASDIYAFGTVLYEMATGMPPFSDSTAGEIDAKHLRKTAKPASRINRDIPAALDEIIAMALMKSPADRYDSAADLGNALLELGTNDNLRREPAISQPRESRELREDREPLEHREPRESREPWVGVPLAWLKHHSRTAMGGVGAAAAAAIVVVLVLTHNPVKPSNDGMQAFAAGLPSTTTVAKTTYAVATPVPLSQNVLAQINAAATTTTAAPPAAAAAAKPPAPVTTTTTQPKATTTAKPAGQLTAPTGLQIALLQANAVLLQWNAVPGATGYVAELTNGNANGTVAFPAFATTPADASFGPLQPNTRYTAIIWPSDAQDIGGPGSNQPAATITFTNP